MLLVNQGLVSSGFTARPKRAEVKPYPRVFVVDDEDFIRDLYRDVFESKGMTVFSAQSGEEAVKIFSTMKYKPDVVIMDHRMPGKDGIETTKEILKMDPSVPIIFSSADDTVREAALAAGAVSFWAKLFPVGMLANAMHRIIAGMTRRQWLAGTLQGESPAPEVRLEAAAALLRFLARGARHSDADLCDITHCAWSVGAGPRLSWTDPRHARQLPDLAPVTDHEWSRAQALARLSGPALITFHCGGQPLSELYVWGRGSREALACPRNRSGPTATWQRSWPAEALRAVFGERVVGLRADDSEGTWRLLVETPSGSQRLSFDEAHRRLAPVLNSHFPAIIGGNLPAEEDRMRNPMIKDKKRRNWPLILRRATQISFVVFILTASVRHSLAEESAASIDAICPFGGLETLWRMLVEGRYIPHTHPSNIVLGIGLLVGVILGGAAFCGWIWPFGTRQDGLTWLRKAALARGPHPRKS